MDPAFECFTECSTRNTLIMSFTGYHNHKICVNVGAPTFLALAVLTFGVPTLRADDSASVLQTDKAFVQAFVQKDTATAPNLVSADFTWIDSVGKRLSRAATLETFPAVANADVEAQLRVYGNTAVVRANHGKVNVMRVWVKQPAGWRIVLYQEVTQVEKSEPAGGAATGECLNPCKE